MQDRFVNLSDKYDTQCAQTAKLEKQVKEENERFEKIKEKLKNKNNEMEKKNVILTGENYKLIETKTILIKEKETIIKNLEILSEELTNAKNKTIAVEGAHMIQVQEGKAVLAGRRFGPSIEDLQEEIEELKEELIDARAKAAKRPILEGSHMIKIEAGKAVLAGRRSGPSLDDLEEELDEIKEQVRLLEDTVDSNVMPKGGLPHEESKANYAIRVSDVTTIIKNIFIEKNQVEAEVRRLEMEIPESNLPNDSSRNTYSIRISDITEIIINFFKEKAARDSIEYFPKGCQTEIGGINSDSGEIGFEHADHEIPYEAKSVTIPMKRIKGAEGRASCYWKVDAEGNGDLGLLCQNEGYVNFEDGEVHSELEIDFEHYVLTTVMSYTVTILDVRGCSICTTEQMHSTISFTVTPPENIPAGLGYVEFVRDNYQVEPNQSKARIRLRRRGSFGRIKKAEIFTRDLSAEEGRDYFCQGNDLGILSFGPAEVYKEINIRISSGIL